MASATQSDFEAFAAEMKNQIAEIKTSLASGTFPAAAYTATLETRLVAMETALAKATACSEAATIAAAAIQAQYSTLQAAHAQQQVQYNSLHQYALTNVERLNEQTSAAKGKGKRGDSHGWQMARPKDLMPNAFSGKEEEWPAWRESVEDYADKIKPGMK